MYLKIIALVNMILQNPYPRAILTYYQYITIHVRFINHHAGKFLYIVIFSPQQAFPSCDIRFEHRRYPQDAQEEDSFS